MHKVGGVILLFDVYCECIELIRLSIHARMHSYR